LLGISGVHVSILSKLLLVRDVSILSKLLLVRDVSILSKLLLVRDVSILSKLLLVRDVRCLWRLPVHVEQLLKQQQQFQRNMITAVCTVTWVQQQTQHNISTATNPT